MDLKDLDSQVNSATSLLKNLEPFLNRAEKWNQGQRFIGAIISLGIAVLLLSGTFPPMALSAFALVIVAISLLTIKRRVVEAEVFAVKDKKGKLRAFLAPQDNSVVLTFLDEAGRLRISLGLSEKGEQNLIFFNSDSMPQAVLAISATGGPTLQLYGEDGKPHIQCNVSEKNVSTISLTQDKGAETKLFVSDDIQGIRLSDERGKSRATFHLNGRNSVLSLSGNHEVDTSVVLGVLDATMPTLLLNGATGKPAIALNIADDGSGKLNLFDRNGSLVVHKP